MKKLILLSLFTSILLFGCMTTDNISLNPSEIEYKEMSGKEFCKKAGFWDSYESNEKLANLFKESKGYKLTNVLLTNIEDKSKNGNYEFVFDLRGSNSGNTVRVDVTDYIFNKVRTEPTFLERFGSIADNKKYNGKFTFYVYGLIRGNAFSGYTSKVILYDIEGIPSQEQIEADIAAEEAEKLAKEEAARKAKAEKQAKIDNIGKQLAQNYIYHGAEEDSLNSQLFNSGALEPGHAYYISLYLVYAGGEMGGAVTSLFANPNYQYVTYASQKVRGEVVNAGNSIFGELPISIVVAGGKAPLYTPIILGVVEK